MLNVTQLDEYVKFEGLEIVSAARLRGEINVAVVLARPEGVKIPIGPIAVIVGDADGHGPDGFPLGCLRQPVRAAVGAGILAPNANRAFYFLSATSPVFTGRPYVLIETKPARFEEWSEFVRSTGFRGLLQVEHGHV